MPGLDGPARRALLRAVSSVPWAPVPGEDPDRRIERLARGAAPGLHRFDQPLTLAGHGRTHRSLPAGPDRLLLVFTVGLLTL